MIQETKQSQNTPVIFEYPLREQIRSFLRLESLFSLFERSRIAVHPDNHLHALKLLFEILEILERGDTRSELIKELSRLSLLFSNLKENPNVDSSKLTNFLGQIKQLHQWVLNYEGKFGDKLRKDPLIETVKYRASIPGGTCQFDCPDLFLFLNQSSQVRQQQLKNWIDDIQGVKTSIEVILRITRDNGCWEDRTAPLGSFMLETSEVTFQLLRVRLSTESQLFPEFSCGKHRSNIHFMRFNEFHKKIAIQYPVEFELACCQ
ncbi:cell division protein ZapD [Aliikangiella sp. G2MR2-5]|uniref:cell division protein ZapD n=1 Tax=Aliikangiella sp. G2MR2-5 TaxID=2788943 RepID=UPI0018AB4CB8